ncbi:MAG: RNA polymerase sporulation sigma factor SigF [Desulforudis sp.]|jgi:RNA polymerase sporulation-specific sigma factor|nr:MAG: RNA polymerase sporulation sigma factor SigF [Desulforudis sp.]
MRARIDINIPNHPLLKDKETRHLIRAAQQGDVKARETLINANLKLVCNVIRRFEGRGYDIDDLFQIGCIGLIKAIDKFDLSFKVKFSTYAVPMIIGEIRRFLRDDTPIRVSRSLKELAWRLQTTRERLQAELDREPTIGEISGALGVPREELVAALEAAQSPASLFDVLHQEEGDAIYIMDQLRNKEQSESTWIESIALRELLENLPERDQKIIMWRFFDDKTQADVARTLGLSQVQVSRLERDALKKLRTMAGEKEN